MAQSKFNVLNRTGYSINWNNSWESINNYSKNFINFFMVDLFLNNLLNDNLFSKDYFLIKKITEKNKNIFFLKKIYKIKLKNKKRKKFNSKVWILKFQNWIIIKVFIYMTKFLINIKKTKKYIKINHLNYMSKFNFF